MSTNEELETSKEELQSANEELTTLNDELKNRNQTLSHLNDDLANLMDNIDTAVVIVDTDLKIKRFTTSAQELLHIMPSDAEHPITEVRLAIHVEDLEKLLLTSIRKLSTVRHEINDRNHWYQMRIRPYITGDKKIFGAVLSFSDITELKKWEAEKKLHTEDLETLVKEQAQKIVQSESLATIGKTAGMVGHDIRNPLQSIVSELYLAKAEVEELSDDGSKKNLKESIAFIEEQLFYINREFKSKEKESVFIYLNKLDFLFAKYRPKSFATALAQTYRELHSLPCFVRPASHLPRCFRSNFLTALWTFRHKFASLKSNDRIVDHTHE